MLWPFVVCGAYTRSLAFREAKSRHEKGHPGRPGCPSCSNRA
jgi:hypothetical protein